MCILLAITNLIWFVNFYQIIIVSEFGRKQNCLQKSPGKVAKSAAIAAAAEAKKPIVDSSKLPMEPLGTTMLGPETPPPPPSQGNSIFLDFLNYYFFEAILKQDYKQKLEQKKIC